MGPLRDLDLQSERARGPVGAVSRGGGYLDLPGSPWPLAEAEIHQEAPARIQTKDGKVVGGGVTWGGGS